MYKKLELRKTLLVCWFTTKWYRREWYICRCKNNIRYKNTQIPKLAYETSEDIIISINRGYRMITGSRYLSRDEK